MEKLLLIGLIAALPMAILNMISKMTGNQFIGFLLLRLPSMIVLFVTIAYFLKLYKII